MYPFRAAGRHDGPAARSCATSTPAAAGGAIRWTRDPERVKRDVRDGYVTIEGAARDYGVVVVGDPDEDPEGLSVDAEATGRLRNERAAR